MNHRPYLGLAIGVVLLFGWVLIGTVGFMLIEQWNLVDSLYMAIITISTVGFREVHPLSINGRLFASLIIVGGLGTAVYTFTRVGQLLLEGELLAILGRRKMKSELEKLQGHQIVCGYGRIGRPVAEGLQRDRVPFSVVDRDAEHEEEFRRRGYLYVIGDATDEETLKAAGVERARAVLALLPSDADNLYLTITAKSINPEVTVIARGQDEKAEMKLKRGGADRVVSPYRIAAVRVVHAAVRPAVVDLMELVTHRQSLQLALEEVRVAERSVLGGRSLADAEIRQRCGVIVVAIKRGTGEMVFNPGPSEKIVPGDVLVAMGTEDNLKKLERVCEVAA